MTARAALCETAAVFRHHHHSEDVALRIDHLMEGVFVSDEHDRLERLAAHLAPDFVYVSPGAVFEGPQGLSDAFSHYRHDAWRQAVLHRTSDVDLHHGNFRYSWARNEKGVTVMEGWSFGWLDAEGRIARIVSFEGLIPGRPA